MRAAVLSGSVAIAALFMAGAGVRSEAAECQEHFDSTFDAVRQVVFERHGCTSATCHSGTVPAGGLDLSPPVAYDNLIDVPPQSVSVQQHPGLARVVPGNKKRSLLWLNVAAAAQPEIWQAPLRAMPLGGLPPLSSDELALVQLWIENGATRDGVVPGTAALVDACLPPLEPLKTEPLAPPPPGVGVQIRAPRQVLPPKSERETCFVSYYDLTDQVPEEFRGPGDTFRYKRVDARQDPLSHHAVVFVYGGATPITSPVWGPFTCKGGERDGQSCTPTDLAACGADAICSSPPVPAVACIGYGPGDAGIGTGETSLFSSMGSSAGGGEGIFQEAPLKGTLVWNSHAFNITDTAAPLDMWINFDFAAPQEQIRPLQRFVDVTAIGKMAVRPFVTDEVCSRHIFDRGTRVLELTSHTHWRGKRFRIFDGDFRCQGGPHDGDACSPFGPDPGLPSSDLCAGQPCASRQPPRAGDCDGDMAVSIDELLTSVNIALETEGVAACPRADADASGGVTVDELIIAVGAALSPGLRDPDASLLFTNLTYADPLIVTFDPPKPMGGPNSVPLERTVTYCALYDNGFAHPEDVKRNSRVPSNSGGCKPTSCAEGAIGQACANNAQCDSSPGAGDGFCDACSVGFGLTTDDEMFVLAGSYVAE